ncbi:MAG: GNAT family N-acetyltransferase [Lachnospiraceae bacterium]|nr:GNAT family N-acetyltransferase [Lachnospiraceae bacterium]
MKTEMNIELIPVDETNREDCIRLKVTEAQSEYIATNESSLEAASENADVARPFVIYADGKAVGFTMFAFDEEYEDPDDRYWLWRFMIDEKFQGRGIGKEALKQIILYFKENGATNIRLSTKAGNVNAISLYKSFGFRDTGEVIDGENLFELDIL